MKSALVIAAAAAAGVSARSLTESQQQYLFSSFVATHEKNYEIKEFFTRFTNFKNNVEAIISHNANPKATFTMAVNQFADMTNAEFAAANKFKVSKHSKNPLNGVPLFNASTRDVPQSVDWTTKQINGINVVGPVQDQGQCGSCWAFSTIGAVESAAVLAGRGFTKLSEQQLVDCANAPKYGNAGCDGGDMLPAYAYLSDYGSISLKDYPYTARDGKCQADKHTPALHYSVFSGAQEVDAGTTNLKAALAIAPVSIALAASDMAFQFYKSGVITSGCGTDVNHALVATGYDTFDVKGQRVEAFVIRNSWGAAWGDKGYVRVGIEGENAQCGLVLRNGAMVPGIESV